MVDADVDADADADADVMMFTWCPQPRVRSCEQSNTAHSNCAVNHGCTGCNCPMPQGPKPGQGGAPHTPTTLFPLKTIKGKGVGGTDPVPIVLLAVKGVQLIFSRGSSSRCRMLPRGARVTCYLGAPVGQSRGKQSKAKQKQSKSNCDAMRVTCYRRARVSHVTLGRACHMLLRGALITRERRRC